LPQLIEHIDAIARKKRRDVLSVRFHPSFPDFLSYDYKRDSERQRVIAWLDAQGIPWQPCGDVADEARMMPYVGEVYVDLPFDPADPNFRKLQTYLENPDGTMRHPEVIFMCLPLEKAMKNTHHDEPGFWERWGECL
jgi:hypothetical protein